MVGIQWIGDEGATSRVPRPEQRWIRLSAADPRACARFWELLLDFELVFAADRRFAVAPRGSGVGPGFWIDGGAPAGDVEGRLDIQVENPVTVAERAMRLGARRILGDVHGGAAVVMSDPGGNVFRVVRRTEPSH